MLAVAVLAAGKGTRMKSALPKVLQPLAGATLVERVLASARNDDNSDFDDKTTGRISAAWQLAEGATTLRGAYGTGIKNPTFTERFGFFTNFVGVFQLLLLKH